MEIINKVEEFDEILKNNKSVFVDFYADWCGPCKMVAPVVEELSTENPDVKFIKVNVDDAPELAERYQIMSIPTMISFKDGAPASQTMGFQQKEALELIVKAAK